MFDVKTPTHQYTQSQLLDNWSKICEYYQPLKQQKRPYASQAGFCPRQSSLRGMLEPTVWQEMSGSLPFYAEIGRGIEKVALQKYAKAGQVASSSFKLPEEFFQGYFNLGGEIDLITNIDGNLGIFDIKSVGFVERSAYAELTPDMLRLLAEEEGIIITTDEDAVFEHSDVSVHQVNLKYNATKKPYPSYLAQVQVYCAITGVNDGWLQYISRRIQDTYSSNDSSPSTSFYPVPLDYDTLVKRVAMILYGIRCRDKRVIAEMPKDIKKSHCSNAFCPFINFCYNSVSLQDMYEYGKHNSVRDIKLIDADTSLTWRSDAMKVARNYVDKRSERQNMLRELLRIPRVNKVERAADNSSQ